MCPVPPLLVALQIRANFYDNTTDPLSFCLQASASPSVEQTLLPFLSHCSSLHCANRVLRPGHSLLALRTLGLVDPCMTKLKCMVEAPDSYLEDAQQNSRHQTAHQGTYCRSYELQVSPHNPHSNLAVVTGWDTCRGTQEIGTMTERVREEKRVRLIQPGHEKSSQRLGSPGMSLCSHAYKIR